MISTLTKLNSIQILRGVAALLVLQVHLFVFLKLFNEIHICGAIGVDIFFVLSGFLMLKSIDRSNGISQFINARFTRIFPALFVVTIIMSILTGTGFGEFLISISQFYIFRQSYNDPIVFSAWSLLFEIFFYFILSLSFFWGQRTVLIFTLIIGFIGLFVKFKQPFLSFFFSNMHLEFVMGASLYFIKIERSKFILIISVLLMFFLMLFGKDFGYDYNGIPRMQILIGNILFPRSLVWGIPSGLFVSQMILLNNFQENVVSKIFVFIGDISYELYLLQVPFFWFFNKYFFKISSSEIKLIVLMISFLTLMLLSNFLKKTINFSWKLM